MMLQSGLPPSFWAESILTANHVINRVTTRSLNGEIPYNLWTGKKPTLTYLKVFGTVKMYIYRVRAANKRISTLVSS